LQYYWQSGRRLYIQILQASSLSSIRDRHYCRQALSRVYRQYYAKAVVYREYYEESARCLYMHYTRIRKAVKHL